ncbi:Argininosuccinate lyase [Candidatus Bilamarchaeum dharawalense]|uniref:Argininosuccinate lyase n=1 Tax=Candidatus Bilamarchaeum dharawalense TaxID=2885759 RepID=A0A5E4LNC8_9ARCH|nr:Argininosuccinate lyase [Candidatus Bilamarchaeum dharawalense]
MLWGGRFSKDPKKNVLLFNSAENILVDEKLVEYDILGSIAHVKMLGKQKILKAEETEELLRALNELLQEWKTGKFKLDPNLEDVHMNVEVAVTKKTPHGKKMHTARSRNDQVNLDLRLYMRDEIKNLIGFLKNLQKSLEIQGKLKVDIPAHTHTRVAQPITNKFWGDGYSVSFEKDIERLEQLYKRVNKNPLGACAISGTSWNIDRDYTAKLLGFDSVEENSLETISSRGELESELVFVCSLVATQLSRIAEDLIWLSYVGLIELPEEYCTGSSIMPNKMNPDPLELIRGRTGRVYGNLLALLTIMKATPTGHNADTQETKRLAMDSVEIVKSCLQMSAEIIVLIKWNQKKAKELIDQGYAKATLLADKLAMEGMSFREAHEKVGSLVKKLQKEGKYLEDELK